RRLWYCDRCRLFCRYYTLDRCLRLHIRFLGVRSLVGPGRLLQVAANVLSHLPQWIDGIAVCTRRVQLLRVRDGLADLVHFRLSQRFITLRAKFPRHLAEIRGHATERPPHRGKILRPDDDDKYDPYEEKLGPA